MTAEGIDTEEVVDLRRRLEEAEETLRAIRNGEVDALVVRGLRDDEVFTLEGGTESYRTFMEMMDTGAAAVDSSGRLLYANHALCGLLHRPLDDLQGQPLTTVFAGTPGAAICALLAGAEIGRHTAEIHMVDGDAETIVLVAATPLSVGLISGHALTFADITSQVRAAAIAEAEKAAQAIISSANEAVVVCDVDGVVTHANAAAQGICAGPLIGRKFAEAVPLVFPGATGLLQTEDLVAMASSGNPVQGLEANAPQAPKVKDYLISAAPLHLADAHASGCVVTMADLSQRKAAEKQQLLLMAELDHRVRNTLALVLSISSRTMSSEETVEGFHKAFTGRIQALAATHSLLAENSWRELSIRDVVHAELRPYVGTNAERLALEDLNVAILPRAAVALGLIFHELATNAVKYGSLSNEDGRVRVVGRRAGEDGRVTVEWSESGGPTVSTPTRRGFGRTVIARSLQYSVTGGAEVDFAPSGIRCTISVPQEDVVA